MKTPASSLLRFLFPALILSVLSSTGGRAQTLFDNFNAYGDGAAFPPASPPSGAPTWVAVETGASGTLSRTTTASAESAFTATAGGRGFLFSDTTASRSGGIETTLTSIFTTAVTLSFDYKIVSGVGAGDATDTTPQFRLRDSTNGNLNGIYLHLGTYVDGNYFIRNVSNSGTSDLMQIAQNTWYRLTITADPTTSKYSLTVLAQGGAETSFTGLSFRGAATKIDTFGFSNSGATTQKGAWALDNISLSAVPEPSTYALIFGGLIFSAVVLRRNRKN